ncbi:alpha/beta fold hydrolase [Ktedonobacter racemifer]|uniref:Alpha/beta hydrolase fold protein n=1 Tax=Ktedonobacter racemifer DSM 44963 TaxID=485913 RepID=D6U2F2_KTERA|nr:alpha/beta hydrolase [Ktedonobacter racemifer]EFH82820.1 alpha/beta hydrolase fold protein [Ktedonobacter racemifer DSM 44963]
MSVLIDRTIALPGVTLHYREAGDPGVPPLVLLHGLMADARDWDEIAPFLAERYHVFALDQRGHGESARPGVYSFELMRDDLKAFADALSLGRFTLIGHSMGGTVAFLFGEQWPERLERLAIEDTPPPFKEPGVPASPELPDEAPEDAPPVYQQNWALVRPIISQVRNPPSSWWNDIHKVTVPTLIIGGGATSHVPQEKLAEVAHLMPDARFVSIEGGGHAIHRNRPEEYKEQIAEFLFL